MNGNTENKIRHDAIQNCWSSHYVIESSYIEKYMKDERLAAKKLASKVDKDGKKKRVRLSTTEILKVETDVKIYNCLLSLWEYYYTTNTLRLDNQFFRSLTGIVKDKYVMSKSRISSSLKRLKEYGYIDYHLEKQELNSEVNFFTIKADKLQEITKTIPRQEPDKKIQF